AELASLENDALREDDAWMRFGARDRIPDRPAFHLDVVTALEARLHAIKRESVRGGVGTVHLRPRPAEDFPWAAHFASEQDFNRRALRSIRAVIDQDQRFAVALMDGPWPVDVDR